MEVKDMQKKKERLRNRQKHYSDEELTSLGIYKEKDKPSGDENKDSKE